MHDELVPAPVTPSLEPEDVEVLLRESSLRDKDGEAVRERFWGFCLDTGASRSVIGSSQEKAYRTLTSHTPQTHDSTTVCRFGSSIKRSEGMTTLRMPLPDGQALLFGADVVDGDIPLLLGLDVMRCHGLIMDFHTDTMRSGQYQRFLPIFSRTCIHNDA